jgi:hypothetical protein
MRHRSPHTAGSAGFAGSEPIEFAIETGRDELDLRFELRGRLHAVLQELEPPTVEWDVVQTILEGAVEAIQAQS